MKLFFGTLFPEVHLHEEEQQHIVKVLRLREGEEIFVTDGEGNLAKGNLVFEGKKASVKVAEIQRNLPGFAAQLHIAIAPTKNIDRTEFFVEKAVEMGISEITFLQTENSERRNINFERFQKQIIAASKQSLRFHFPKLNNLTKLSEFLKSISVENTFVAHCNETLERSSLSEIFVDKGSSLQITMLIGPEGDFSHHEITLLQEAGVRAVSLGSQRLRTETAGIFVAAWNYSKMI